MTLLKPNPESIEKVVNENLAKHPVLRELGAQVIHGTASCDSSGWSVSVGTVRQPKRTYEYIVELTEVSEETRKQLDIDITVAPSGANPLEVNKR
ncbi:MAG: hypothetical protein GC164_13675 [Phycisphaera sp.]|nr:hypothetical protein [Phycisphaera sp.]